MQEGKTSQDSQLRQTRLAKAQTAFKHSRQFKCSIQKPLPAYIRISILCILQAQFVHCTSVQCPNPQGSEHAHIIPIIPKFLISLSTDPTSCFPTSVMAYPQTNTLKFTQRNCHQRSEGLFVNRTCLREQIHHATSAQANTFPQMPSVNSLETLWELREEHRTFHLEASLHLGGVRHEKNGKLNKHSAWNSLDPVTASLNNMNLHPVCKRPQRNRREPAQVEMIMIIPRRQIPYSRRLKLGHLV